MIQKGDEKAKKEDDGDKDHDKDRDALDNNIDIEMVHICNPMVNSHGINNDAASERLQLKSHHRRRRGSMIHHAGHARRGQVRVQARLQLRDRALEAGVHLP
mgnify:CR=1 FL=1